MRLILTALLFCYSKGRDKRSFFLGSVGAWRISFYNAIKLICLFIICMTTFIAYANIQQPFSFDEIPTDLVPEYLRMELHGNSRITQRHQCRRLAHFLLWQLLKTAGKSTALLEQIYRTQSGRPQFSVDNIDFNISHSGDWVAVLLHINKSEKSAVGIDIEFSKKRSFSALMAHFAPQAEQEWFAKQLDEEQAFYRCWCLREAVLKSQGVGIVKLSSVTHLPEQLQIFSDYCPKGQLLFTDELPFYFAAFINQLKIQPHFYQWDRKKLLEKNIKKSLIYQVNE